jgi:ATP-dependent exoDNAse (exonuclease V) beta subunit
MERLLYVALTRAQHTLVLAFDHELFAKASGEAHSASHVRWLRADKAEINYEFVTAVSANPSECSMTATHLEKNSTANADKIDNQLGGEKIDKKAALANASDFVRKMNPSGLPAEGISTDEIWMTVERPAPSASPAVRYGVWWHEFAQKLNWSANAVDGDDILETGELLSPDPARSKREWQMLREHLAGGSDFRRRLSAELVHREMPFFWKIDDSKCLEGIVDLALFDRKAGKWLILDWKTNRITADKLENLRLQYRPQIAAYWKAVAQMSGMPVEAGIYSTANGQFAVYEEKELAVEWERLRTLPLDDLSSEIDTDERVSSRVRRG